MYVVTPEAKNPTLEETFSLDPFAAATSLPKVTDTSLLMLCYVCLSFLTAFHQCNRDDAFSCSTYHSILPLPFMQLVGPVFHEKEKRSEGLYICRTFQTIGSAY